MMMMVIYMSLLIHNTCSINLQKGQGVERYHSYRDVVISLLLWFSRCRAVVLQLSNYLL